jgi:hypothetical protein
LQPLHVGEADPLLESHPAGEFGQETLFIC